MGLNPIGNPDWARDVTDRIDGLVQTVRSRTTAPITVLVRAVVFGTLVAITGLVAVTLLIIMILRVLQILLAFPFDAQSAVWISYVLLGGIFVVTGALLMSRRHLRDEMS
jgi:hypothetical protein